jgi:hypothetical protein
VAEVAIEQHRRNRRSQTWRPRAWTRSARGGLLPKHIQTQKILVTLAERPHPFPSRTRKLSSPAPKILRGQPFGKIGRRQDFCVSGFPGTHIARTPRGTVRAGAFRGDPFVYPRDRDRRVRVPVLGGHRRWPDVPGCRGAAARSVCDQADLPVSRCTGRGLAERVAFPRPPLRRRHAANAARRREAAQIVPVGPACSVLDLPRRGGPRI